MKTQRVTGKKSGKHGPITVRKSYTQEGMLMSIPQSIFLEFPDTLSQF